jgi:RimJ/RimL family protein N-acetyltransferase
MEDGTKNPTLEQVRNQWMRRMERTERVNCYIVLLDMRPIAYIQWYPVSDFAESMALVPESENVAGIDVFIGEAEWLYRGLGPVFMSKFLKDIVFAIPETQSCMVDPEPENTAAIRAYEKVGFKHSHTVWDAKYGVYAYIMFLRRDDIRTPSDVNCV